MKEIEIYPGVHITAYNCIWYEPKDVIIAADFHIGYEKALERDGISVPSFQKENILNRLSTVKKKYNPETYVVLGDFKHDFGRTEDQEFRDILDIIDYMTEDSSLVLIKGNHDNYLRNLSELKGVPLYENYLEIGSMLLSHGHTKIEWDDLLVIGHEHPALKLRDEVGSLLRLPCYLFHEERKILVLPAFSPVAEGRDVVNSSGFFSEVLEDFNDEIEDFRLYAISENGLIDFHSVKEVRSAFPEFGPT